MNFLVSSLHQRWIPLLGTPLLGVVGVSMRVGLARFTTSNGKDPILAKVIFINLSI